MLKSPPPARYAALLPAARIIAACIAACILAQPSTAQPGMTQPGTAQPGTAQPGVAQKSSTAARPTPAHQAGDNIAAARAAMSAGVNAANTGDLPEARRQFARAVALAPKVSA